MDCAHQKSQITCRVVANGSTQYVRQCDDCGEVVGSCIPKRAALAEAPSPRPFDSDFRLRKREQALAARGIEWDEAQGVRRVEYAAYLLTPAWRERRRLVLERAGRLCEGCREVPATEVHHTTYAHIGDEFLWELRAVCALCHERMHR